MREPGGDGQVGWLPVYVACDEGCFPQHLPFYLPAYTRLEDFTLYEGSNRVGEAKAELLGNEPIQATIIAVHNREALG
jgi:hypothetical protein